jgi:hypothetical protein
MRTAMAYIIERNNRFYVVAYDGIDRDRRGDLSITLGRYLTEQWIPCGWVDRWWVISTSGVRQNRGGRRGDPRRKACRR